MTIQIAILCVRTIAEIGPQTVKRPGIEGKHLPGEFEARVGVPELGGEDESTEGFGTAGVGDVWICLGGAGEIGRFLAQLLEFWMLEEKSEDGRT